MKQFIVAILLFIICLLSFQDLTKFVLFKANQAAISANLCVNKKDKASNCQGKCQLSKMFAQNKETDSSDIPMSLPDSERLNYTYLILNEQFTTLNLRPVFVSNYSVHDKIPKSTHLFELLRPPIA